MQKYFSPDWPVANLLKSHGFLRQPQGWLGWPFSRGVLGWSRWPWLTVGFMGIHDLGRSRRLGGAHTSNGKATHSGIYLDYCSFCITPLCEFPWAMGWGIWDRPSWYIHPASRASALAAYVRSNPIESAIPSRPSVIHHVAWCNGQRYTRPL